MSLGMDANATDMSVALVVIVHENISHKRRVFRALHIFFVLFLRISYACTDLCGSSLYVDVASSLFASSRIGK